MPAADTAAEVAAAAAPIMPSSSRSSTAGMSGLQKAAILLIALGPENPHRYLSI